MLMVVGWWTVVLCCRSVCSLCLGGWIMRRCLGCRRDGCMRLFIRLCVHGRLRLRIRIGIRVSVRVSVRVRIRIRPRSRLMLPWGVPRGCFLLLTFLIYPYASSWLALKGTIMYRFKTPGVFYIFKTAWFVYTYQAVSEMYMYSR